jgi:hypothetical protein
MRQPLDADSRLSIESSLLEIDGVLHAAIDVRSQDIWIVRDPDVDAGPIELAVRSRLAAMGRDPTAGVVRISLPAAGGPRRRIRFLRADRVDEPGGITVQVSLEWNDVVHTASASGERGAAMELKITAQAALLAVEKVSGHAIGLKIVGIKKVHAFDSEIIVASILRTDGVPQRLIGAVIVSSNPIDSAALAVLSGLNRTLGNFLHTTD